MNNNEQLENKDYKLKKFQKHRECKKVKLQKYLVIKILDH